MPDNDRKVSHASHIIQGDARNTCKHERVGYVCPFCGDDAHMNENGCSACHEVCDGVLACLDCGEDIDDLPSA